MNPEPSSIASRDWRLQAVTTLAEDWKSPWTGILHGAGTPVTVTGFVRHGKEIVAFGMPSPVAIYLSLALKAAELAKAYLADRFNHTYNAHQGGNAHLLSDGEPEFFDALENLAACVVFSYSALEAFTNSMIPDDFQWERERLDHKCKEVYTREQIERFINLDTKLDEILPTICSVPSPKGTVLWQNYDWLKNHRDRIIHLKTADWKESGPENVDGSIWTSLVSERITEAPNYALSLVNHYYPDAQQKPRWINKLVRSGPH